MNIPLRTHLKEAFWDRNRVLIPVIHAKDEEQACENAEIAFANQAAGIFLIGHDLEHYRLIHIYEAVRKNHPYGWIGLNLLGAPLQFIPKAIHGSVNGIWTDDSGFDTESSTHQKARDFRALLDSHRPKTLWFGGFAFKYQPQPTLLGQRATEASEICHVLTTSGEKTGEPSSVEKIIEIRQHIGPGRWLAIASGITPENVSEYRPYTNAFLVATGISKDFHTLDPDKVRDVAQQLQGKDPINSGWE